jgi:serine/threonine-protein kinase
MRWLRETAIALDCAHEHDVVHRDVKPANLLLDEHGRLAVGDFGIATVASEASVTQTGQVLGTAAYISPEQARGEPATAASDRYALAVVAFELLTGARPFPVDHPAAQARAHVQARIPDATEVAPDLPPAVDAVLRDGLAKDPDARPATAEELVDRLEDALGDEATAVVPPPTATTRRFEVPPAAERGAAGPPTTAARRPVAAAAPGVRRLATGAHRPTTPAPWPPVATHGRRRWPAVAALAALLLAAGAVAAIALTGGGGGSSGGGSATTTSARAGTSSTGRSHTTGTHTSRTASASTATKSSKPSTSSGTSTSAAAAGDPRQLNDRGFALIQQGNSAAAVPLLQGSVQGFRQQGRTGELDYAFALYNLATALRATGHPADAIPLLEERLRISSYKRDVVQRELALARQQAGQPAGPGAAGAAPKAGKGNRGHGGGEGRGHGGEGDEGGGEGDGGD